VKLRRIFLKSYGRLLALSTCRYLGKVEFKFQVIMMHLLELKKVMFILQKEATINNGT